MGLRRLTSERLARTALVATVVVVPFGLGFAWWQSHNTAGVVTVHARMSEDGGWSPETLHAVAGEPLQLRLVSDDVTHGFAFGRSSVPAVDLPPGEVVETEVTFDQPGTYTYYCTRWCGPNHWRMRGVIEVSGGEPSAPVAQTPLYETLGLDLDAPHPAAAVPAARPSAARGEDLAVELPDGLRTRDDFIRRPPSDTWRALRNDSSTADLSDAEVWDLVADLWRTTTTDETLREGEALYAQNCAACHGENGDGAGVVAKSLPSVASMDTGELAPAEPADFTDASTMLGASPALLQGKILRGGMGTGMPYWGPILTEAQMWALVDYLWSFQFGES